MANPSDSSAEAGNRLPAPELNPLLNPVLEQNLGRWAQVYLNSPPEQRDEAVGELLRELKTELQAQNPKPAGMSPGNLSAPPPPSQLATTPERTAKTPPENELEWLRSKNFSLAYEYNETGPRWIWKIIAPILALVVAGFLYSQWKTRLTAEQHPTTSPALGRAAAPQRTPITPMQAAQPASPENAPESVPPALPKASLSNSRTDSGLDSPAAYQAQDSAGRSELQRAQDYLTGRNGVSQDSAAAADWLWRAVRRENPTAEVLLADLYVRGEGVPRSCEQARLLLTAAAKRGKPEAADKLRSLETGGCS